LGTSAELYGNRAGNLLTNFSGLTRGGVELLRRRSCTDPSFLQPRGPASAPTHPLLRSLRFLWFFGLGVGLSGYQLARTVC
jgi:hypothetical protein